MSSKYNRFLLSTCLPVMALGLCIPLTANAGFEWTPPEKMQPVEVTPAPVDEMGDMEIAPMPEDEAVETVIMEDKEPPISITVIEEDTAPIEPDVEIVVIEEDTEEFHGDSSVAPVAPEEEVLIEQVAIEEEVQDPIVEEMVKEAEETEAQQEEQVIEVVESMDIESSPAPDKSDSNSLTLNPYPLENKEPEQVVASVDPMEEHIQWNVPESFAVVEGFGKEMPLALALSQIVPAEYAYSFGKGVNPGMRVSWQGGSPWNEVLAAALAPHDVGVSIRYKKVLLSPIEEESTAALETTTIEAQESPEAEMVKPVEQEIQPEFQDDVEAVEQQTLEQETMDAAEEIKEDASEMMDKAEDAVEDAPAAPEEAMNDALREVYGDSPMDDEAMPDAAPIELDGDKGASNSMVEELLEPIEVTAEEEAGVPHPDMDELSEGVEEVEESLVERINVLDPGREEGVQPSIADIDDADAEMQKKN